MGLHAGETAWPNAGLGSSIGRVRSTPVIWPLDTWGLIGWQSCSHSTSACNSSDTACHCTNHTTTVRSTVQYSTVKYSTVQYSTVQYRKSQNYQIFQTLSFTSNFGRNWMSTTKKLCFSQFFQLCVSFSNSAQTSMFWEFGRSPFLNR